MSCVILNLATICLLSAQPVRELIILYIVQLNKSLCKNIQCDKGADSILKKRENQT